MLGKTPLDYHATDWMSNISNCTYNSWSPSPPTILIDTGICLARSSEAQLLSFREDHGPMLAGVSTPGSSSSSPSSRSCVASHVEILHFTLFILEQQGSICLMPHHSHDGRRVAGMMPLTLVRSECSSTTEVGHGDMGRPSCARLLF